MSAVDPALARLRVYQEARTLASLTYGATARCPTDRLTDQMRRSAVSVASNIAEGHGRTTPRDKRRYFDMARSSLSELRAQIDVARDTQWIVPSDATEMTRHAIWTSRLLAGLRRSIRPT